MKKGLYVAIYLIVTFVILRFIVPVLMSAQDTMAVISGLISVGAWGLASALIAHKFITKKEAK
jgi:hypothetical protein